MFYAHSHRYVDLAVDQSDVSPVRDVDVPDDGSVLPSWAASAFCSSSARRCSSDASCALRSRSCMMSSVLTLDPDAADRWERLDRAVDSGPLNRDPRLADDRELIKAPPAARMTEDDGGREPPAPAPSARRPLVPSLSLAPAPLALPLPLPPPLPLAPNVAEPARGGRPDRADRDDGADGVDGATCVDGRGNGKSDDVALLGTPVIILPDRRTLGAFLGSNALARRGVGSTVKHTHAAGPHVFAGQTGDGAPQVLLVGGGQVSRKELFTGLWQVWQQHTGVGVSGAPHSKLAPLQPSARLRVYRRRSTHHSPHTHTHTPGASNAPPPS